MGNVDSIASPTPQQAAAAPVVHCPKCGRRMQLISSSPSTHHYACYAHSTQNSDSSEPYYFNYHIRSTAVTGDGRLNLGGAKEETK